MKPLPRLVAARQQFEGPRVESLDEAVTGQLTGQSDLLRRISGMEIAVAVGSRGISNLAGIVRSTIRALLSAGASPIIVPAMGSHGGGTPEGQAKILASYGVTEEAMGVPILSSLETISLGETSDGAPVPIDRTAFETSGILLINRIKPHTDFEGDVGSGLMKMMAVGLSNREGADSFHAWTMRFGYQRLIESKAAVVLDSGKILGGIAIVENASHETAGVEFLPAARLVTREKELFRRARELMPSLPADDIDVLIVDRIGKNISGAGMDPNVTGRWCHINSIFQKRPRVTRIVVLDVSAESYGNATGIGLADFCSQRVVDKLERKSTFLNAITSRHTVAGHIPIAFDTDRETIQQTMTSLDPGKPPEAVRVLRIRDTLSLDRFEASEALIPELRANPRVSGAFAPQEIKFDSAGALLPLRS